MTIDILLTRVRCTEPNTRSRKRACDYCFKLADFAGLEGRQKIKEFTGSYSAAAVNPRTLPNDSAIALFRNSIESPSWQWVVGVMAAYGLRNHEVFRLEMRDFPVARVTEGKTGDRFVYPLYPEWAQEWKLQDVILPALSLEYSNAKLGTKVSGWFYDHKAPFRAYDLRHAWARRAFEFRLSVNEAAKMLGHSQKVHTTTYQAWIDEEVYLKSIKSIIGRDDRPLTPRS